jgi:hypothetical protein
VLNARKISYAKETRFVTCFDKSIEHVTIPFCTWLMKDYMRLWCCKLCLSSGSNILFASHLWQALKCTLHVSLYCSTSCLWYVLFVIWPPTNTTACCKLLTVYVPYTWDMSASDNSHNASNMGTLDTHFTRLYLNSLLYMAFCSATDKISLQRVISRPICCTLITNQCCHPVHYKLCQQIL